MTKISNQYSLTNVLFADTTNGRVGVNNTSPTVALDVTGAGKFSGAITANIGSYNPSFIAIGSSTGNGQIQFSGSSNYSIGAGTDFGGMGLYVGGAYRTYILSNGNVGIGTTSPNKLLELAANTPVLRLTTTTQNTPSGIEFGVLNGGTYGYAKIDVTNVQDYDTNLRFWTTAATSTTQVERMRLTKDGNLTIGSTNTQDARLTLCYAGGVEWAVGPKSGTSSFAIIGSTGGGGGVYVSNGGTSWAAWSDRRVKKNIENLNYGLSEILSISPVRFNYLTDDNDNADRIGFIAQDVQEYIPEMVNVAYDDILGMSSTDLVPVLVKAIQEQQIQINELKALINA